MHNKKLGDFGEEAACIYLENREYVILERNYRRSHGEIDIIAQDGECIVFIEVKARTNNRYGAPKEAVNKGKQQRIISVATEYLKDNFPGAARRRCDVIEVMAVGFHGEYHVQKVNHLKNAFPR